MLFVVLMQYIQVFWPNPSSYSVTVLFDFIAFVSVLLKVPGICVNMLYYGTNLKIVAGRAIMNQGSYMVCTYVKIK